MTVYPRWRGEHNSLHTQRLAVDGLSPLARGTRKNSHHATETIRFIPAGAGNTCRVWGSTGAGAGNTSMVRGLYSVTPVYPRWRGEHVGRNARFVVYKRFIPAGAGNT